MTGEPGPAGENKEFAINGLENEAIFDPISVSSSFCIPVPLLV